jgi:hypothetical protein
MIGGRIRNAMDNAFISADEAFRHADKILKDAPKGIPKEPVENTSISYMTINFKRRRIKHFFKFLGCAIQILFTGKTQLKIRKNNS